VPEQPGFAHSHSHDHRAADARVRVGPRTRRVVLALLALAALGTVLGLALLWPDYARVGEISARADASVAGTVYAQGEILSIGEACAAPGGETGECRIASVGIRSGDDAGRVVSVELRGGLLESGLAAGDRIELAAFPGAASLAGEQQRGPVYTVVGVQRHLPLIVLALVFVAVVVAVGRLRGLLALPALGISAGVLLAFVLPALVGGGPGLLIGIVASSAIMFVTLFFVHGFTMRTAAALIGTLCGILIISGVSELAVRVTRLSGVGDEATGLLTGMASEIDFRGLLSCSILIAGLGILNDVTITQASSVWELRAAAPEMPRREVYSRAMRIGRDHIASTVYTVFFAYAGAAISVLILIYLHDRPLLSLLTGEDIATELVRTLCGSIGLVLAVPITTWVASRLVPAGRE
jgi:uncharacterized membrane protein